MFGPDRYQGMFPPNSWRITIVSKPKDKSHLHFLQVQGLWSVSAMMAGPGGELSSAIDPPRRLEVRDLGWATFPLLPRR